jgi:glycine oxidase
MNHVLIIGGGVIGLLTAYELSHNQRYQVTLVEMGDTGQESSWAGGGILSPLYPWHQPEAITALAHWSQQIYPQLCQDLYKKTQTNPEYDPCGLLTLDEEQCDQAITWGEQHQITVQRITAQELKQCEPEIHTLHHQACLLPQVAQVRNPRLTKALQNALRSRITISEQEEVLELDIRNNKIAGVHTTKRHIAADIVIVCAGAWTARILSALGQIPNIKPVRGQMMLLRTEPQQIKHITLYRGNYIIPRRDGHLLVGGIVEDSGFTKATTLEARDALYHAAVQLYPFLQHRAIEGHWAGLRPGTPKGIPYICAYPEVDGLFLNAGHFRNGLVTGPASARLIADIIDGRSPVLSIEPYRIQADH